MPERLTAERLESLREIARLKMLREGEGRGGAGSQMTELLGHIDALTEELAEAHATATEAVVALQSPTLAEARARAEAAVASFNKLVAAVRVVAAVDACARDEEPAWARLASGISQQEESDARAIIADAITRMETT